MKIRWFFTETFTLSLDVLHWARHITDAQEQQQLNNHKTIFFEGQSITFLMVCRLMDFALVVLK